MTHSSKTRLLPLYVHLRFDHVELRSKFIIEKYGNIRNICGVSVSSDTQWLTDGKIVLLFSTSDKEIASNQEYYTNKGFHSGIDWLYTVNFFTLTIFLLNDNNKE